MERTCEHDADEYDVLFHADNIKNEDYKKRSYYEKKKCKKCDTTILTFRDFENKLINYTVIKNGKIIYNNFEILDVKASWEN